MGVDIDGREAGTRGGCTLEEAGDPVLQAGRVAPGAAAVEHVGDHGRSLLIWPASDCANGGPKPTVPLSPKLNSLPRVLPGIGASHVFHRIELDGIALCQTLFRLAPGRRVWTRGRQAAATCSAATRQPPLCITLV